MRFAHVLAAVTVTLGGIVCSGLAADAARPAGAPALDPATLHSLGVYWIVAGDDNRNATVALSYRAAGSPQWRAAMPLHRVERGAHRPEKHPARTEVPEGAWLFAGSALLLQPGTAYELKLTLSDPDGEPVEKTLAARTLSEPVAPKDARVLHVKPAPALVDPGDSGQGTEASPFLGLEHAQAAARPGDVLLLHAGTYPGTFTITKSGEPGRAIVWRGAGDGPAILDGQGDQAKRPGRAVSAVGVRDVWLEDLILRRADYAVVGHRSQRLVLRRCVIRACDYGLTCTGNDDASVTGFFITDNVMEGPCAWPRSKGIENPRGVQVTGTGHVVAYNRIRGFADAIDTFGSPECRAIDIHHNDISECTDDGIELDYSQRNTRAFFNRLTNVYQGISVQPVHGGPAYVFRNAIYNLVAEPFKMHNSPSGAIFLHNTTVKAGVPQVLWTNEPVRHSLMRNNLFVGTTGRYCFEITAPMLQCDFDYDGFAGGPFEVFLKWNNQRYATLEDVKAKAPVYKHAVLVDAATVFASGVRPPEDPKKQAAPTASDLRLKAGSAAIDAGAVLPGVNDDFAGKAPDLGAFEFGAELPAYGPRK